MPTSGLLIITPKTVENVIANDKSFSAMSLNPAELLNLSILEKLTQERTAKQLDTP